MENIFLLKKVPFFSSLHVKEIKSFACRLETQSFAKGEVLCEEGQSGGQALYIVAAGQLNVWLGDKILSTLTVTNYFGEVSLLSGEPHSATIKAVTDGSLLVINKDLFEEILAAHPEIIRWLSEVLGKKLRQTIQLTSKPERHQKILAVFSQESGVGKSVLAANLAASLWQQTGKKTILVDYTFSAGSSASLLGLKLTNFLAELLKDKETISESDIQACLVERADGPDVLALHHQTDGGSLSLLKVANIFGLLRNKYPLIIVDLPLNLNRDVLNNVLAIADQGLLLIRDNLNSGCTAEKFLNDLENCLPGLKTKIRLGAFLASQHLQPRALTNYHFVLPYEKEIVKVTLGSFIKQRPLSLFSLSVNRLARELMNLRIGLALSAGMAPGLAHIGVLKVFQREHLSVDLIAGTSGGALFGSAFAAHIPLLDVEKVVCSIGHFKLLSLLDFTFVPYAGFIRGDLIVDFIKSFLGSSKFEDLPIPFKVVTTDLESGEVYIYEKGSVLEALRASISVPGIFIPCKHQGKLLVDGATVSPLPVEVLFRRGMDKVVAVNLCSDPTADKRQGQNGQRQKKPTLHIFDMITHSHAITSHHIAQTESLKADLLISPDTSAFKWRDYHRAKEIIACGERAAEAALPSIRNLIKTTT